MADYQSTHTGAEIDAAVNKIKELNLENSTEGTDNVVLKYSGDVDSTHFPSASEGESNAMLGEANTDTTSAKRNIVGGKLNHNEGSNNIIAGLQNTNTGNHNIGTGQGTTNAGMRNIFAAYNANIGSQVQNSAIVGEDHNITHAANSLIVGDDNNITTLTNGAAIGAGLDNTDASAYGKVIVGRMNARKTNTMFEVGVGTPQTTYKNGFEVLKDGRAKVLTAPTESDDVVRKNELDPISNKVSGIIRVGGRTDITATTNNEPTPFRIRSTDTNYSGLSFADGNNQRFGTLRATRTEALQWIPDSGGTPFSISKGGVLKVNSLTDGTTTKTMTEVLAGGGGSAKKTYKHTVEVYDDLAGGTYYLDILNYSSSAITNSNLRDSLFNCISAAFKDYLNDKRSTAFIVKDSQEGFLVDIVVFLAVQTPHYTTLNIDNVVRDILEELE